MGKILDWGALKDEVELRRSRGERIAFTNGCFDILHVGQAIGSRVDALHHEGFRRRLCFDDCLIDPGRPAETESGDEGRTDQEFRG